MSTEPSPLISSTLDLLPDADELILACRLHLQDIGGPAQLGRSLQIIFDEWSAVIRGSERFPDDKAVILALSLLTLVSHSELLQDFVAKYAKEVLLVHGPGAGDVIPLRDLVDRLRRLDPVYLICPLDRIRLQNYANHPGEFEPLEGLPWAVTPYGVLYWILGELEESELSDFSVTDLVASVALYIGETERAFDVLYAAHSLLPVHS